jgi:hypothetical protein
MAILTMFEIQGDADEIMRVMSDVFGPDTEAVAKEHGGISNTVVETDDGVLVVNHWENEEGMEAFAALMRPKAEASGSGEQVGWRKYKVLQHRVP